MSFRIELAKERFKFAASHFTIFSESEAEGLHGHNYALSVVLEYKEIDPDTGLSSRFSDLKSEIDNLCEALDEKILIPTESPFIELGETSTNIELKFSGRFYSFPKLDCKLLNIANTSSECLAQWVYDELKDTFKSKGAQALEITIQESQGQRVTFKK